MHFAHRLQSLAAYGHLIFVVVIVALLLADVHLVAVTREVGRTLRHILHIVLRFGSGCGGCCLGCMGGSVRFQLGRLGCSRLFGLLSGAHTRKRNASEKWNKPKSKPTKKKRANQTRVLATKPRIRTLIASSSAASSSSAFFCSSSYDMATMAKIKLTR